MARQAVWRFFFLPFSQHLETWSDTFDYIFPESPSVTAWGVLSFWQKPVRRETNTSAGWQTAGQTDKERQPQRQMLKVQQVLWSTDWPEVSFFRPPFSPWFGLGLVQCSAHYLLILLRVWRAGRIYHRQNLGDYTQTSIQALFQQTERLAVSMLA